MTEAILKKYLQLALTDATLLLEDNIKKLTPVDKGRLRASIHSEIDLTNLTGIVGTDVEYAPWIEFGFRRRIKPKKGDSKAKIERKNSDIIYFVNQSPYAMFRRGFLETTDDINKILQKYLDLALNEILDIALKIF